MAAAPPPRPARCPNCRRSPRLSSSESSSTSTSTYSSNTRFCSPIACSLLGSRLLLVYRLSSQRADRTVRCTAGWHRRCDWVICAWHVDDAHQPLRRSSRPIIFRVVRAVVASWAAASAATVAGRSPPTPRPLICLGRYVSMASQSTRLNLASCWPTSPSLPPSLLACAAVRSAVPSSTRPCLCPVFSHLSTYRALIQLMTQREQRNTAD